MTGTIKLGYVGWLLIMETMLLFGLYLELKDISQTFKSIQAELVKLNNNGNKN